MVGGISSHEFDSSASTSWCECAGCCGIRPDSDLRHQAKLSYLCLRSAASCSTRILHCPEHRLTASRTRSVACEISHQVRRLKSSLLCHCIPPTSASRPSKNSVITCKESCQKTSRDERLRHRPIHFHSVRSLRVERPFFFARSFHAKGISGQRALR